jgi:2-keto-4-pentenoate hydratase/2-oxohepta-3-ene-1,7-dioic acid hydratase in catechol pathway
MKIICIGLNYRKHAIEMGRPLPNEPVVFLKPDSSILKNNKPFFLPGFSSMIQYETEVVSLERASLPNMLTGTMMN